MSQDTALAYGQQAMWLIIQVAAPAVLAGLIVGVIISVFQAATSIQEQSLVFVPKVLALMGALALTGGWMMTRLVEFARVMLMSVANGPR
jgi:flagellar biosynthetic protein FliQ